MSSTFCLLLLSNAHLEEVCGEEEGGGGDSSSSSSSSSSSNTGGGGSSSSSNSHNPSCAPLLSQHFLSSLRYVIIDESHVYTGTFGSHVANVIRRLIRLCSLYDNPGPQFVCCSATIYNPAEHFGSLVPLGCLGGNDKLAVITQDTSPRGRKVGSSSSSSSSSDRTIMGTCTMGPSLTFPFFPALFAHPLLLQRCREVHGQSS